MRKSIVSGSALLIVGALGMVGGFTLGRFPTPSARGQLLREGQEKLINHLLACEIADKKEFKEFRPFEKKIQEFIAQKTDGGKASAMAVYFRALNSGRWVAVNENTAFEPASLLKVPIVIAYYQLAKSNPSILTKKILFPGKVDDEFVSNITSSKTLKAGSAYTVAELLEYMIIYSDNDARTLLVQNMDQDALYKIFTDLGITLSKDVKGLNTSDATMSAKTYASFFRVLYSATYLDKIFSEKALELLTRTEFTQGLVAGVPSHITVAHKFGERASRENTQSAITRELHDCGIVYYPEHPYLLCVMTQGHDFTQLANVIAGLSRLVYTEADTTLFKQ